MKTLTKIVCLSLSTALISSCTATKPQTVGDSTVVGDSTSIVDSTENFQSLDSSDGEGVVIDLTEEKDDENWLKAPEGFDSFSYDRETYHISNYEMWNFEQVVDSIYKFPIPIEYDEYFEKYDADDYVYIKARLTGDSINVIYGKSADVEIRKYLSSAYSPVLIEEIVDARGNEIDFVTGEVIYVAEEYIKQNEYYVKTLEDIIATEYYPDYELNPEDEYVSMRYNVRMREYEYYKKHQDDNWVNCRYIYPMEKDKSYLILVKTTPIDYLSEGCPPLYETAYFNMNLSGNEPDSYGEEVDETMPLYEIYVNYWHACKELYGEYFE